jgi:RNA polymerase sigma factor (sigma-70 family)
MRIRAPASDARHQDILELEPLLRRVVGARVRDRDTVDDLVQEALARVIAARERLDDEAVTPYAIVTARNLVTSLAREQERGRRHRPRLVDLSEPERPEDAALRQEEAAAVEAALAGLPDHEREAVVAHEVEGVDTATLAEARRSTRARSGSSWPGPGPGCASTTCWPCAGSSCPPSAAGRCCWPCPRVTGAGSWPWTPAATSWSARPAPR